MTRRILVTGSRRWTDRRIIEVALEGQRKAFGDNSILVHGACEYGGADIIARDIWRAWGLPDEPHPAERDRRGRIQGPKRNWEMVRLGADICLAFPMSDSRGTWQCIKAARRSLIPVIVYRQKED